MRPYWTLPLALAMFFGCGGGADPVAGDGGTDNNGGNNNGGNNGPACAVADLIGQCPPGSNPRLEIVSNDACGVDLEVSDDGGAVTGVCVTRSGCYLICDFVDPCRCGVDRIDDSGVFCVDCMGAAACGNGLCEGGEDPTVCAIDCAERCASQEERCFGDDRQECNLQGVWEDVACREDQTCDFGSVNAALATVCQTKSAPVDGTFPGNGDWGVPITAPSDGIRFAVEQLACGPVSWLDGGDRLLLRSPGGLFTVAERDCTEIRSFSYPDALAPLSQTWLAGVARINRWPQVGGIEEDRLLTVAAVVHDGAFVLPGGFAMDYPGTFLVGSYLIGLDATTAERTMITWEPRSGAIESLLRVDSPVPTTTAFGGVAVSPNGAVIADVRADGVALLWNRAERKLIGAIQTGAIQVAAVHFAPTRPYLLVEAKVGAGNPPGTTDLWDLTDIESGQATRLWRSGERGDCAFSPDGDVLACAEFDRGSYVIIEAATGVELHNLGAGGFGSMVGFHPAGGELLIGRTSYRSSL